LGVVAQRRSSVGLQPQTAAVARRHRPDYWLLVISALLLAVGLIVVYSISPGLAVEKNVGEHYFINKQLIAVGLGIVSFVAAANLSLKAWERLQNPLLVAAVLSAIAVRLFGEEVNGAYRWIHVAGLSFQSVELIKFALLVWVAGFLAARIAEGTLGDFKRTFRPLLIALGALAVVVAGVQSDLGSTGVAVIMMAAMAFVAGLPMRNILLIGGGIVIVLVLAIASSDYRQHRLMTFLNPAQDCLSTGYQACQALIAVGSGGMVGLGLGNSVQAFGYLPEAENDSIFAIYAEKFGFLGVTILLALFLAFFARIKHVLERAPDDFTRLLVTGIFAWLSTQALINIGAMLGVLPLKGITLPFISYGGTSVVFVMAAVGLVYQVSRYTLYSVPRAAAPRPLGTTNARSNMPPVSAVSSNTLYRRRGE
jgi:cell division protein FtsW